MDVLELSVLTDRRSKLRDHKKHRGDQSMMVNLNALNKCVPTAGSPPAQTRPVCLCLDVALRSPS